MPLTQDAALKGRGTRFKLFPQMPRLEAFNKPETVWVSPPPGRIVAGPADDRMYVVDPQGNKSPYDSFNVPPYRGSSYPPVPPDAQGHFDYLEIDSREFQAAHMYGILRRVLDIWEGYFGGRIEWHFRAFYPRLELIPHVNWENAQSGCGFLETGYGLDEQGQKQPYCLNFDVLAHELGHMLIYAKVGIPLETTQSSAFFGFHESGADLTALIAVLHFDSFVNHLLECSQGNLYTLNELNRIGELSATEQIRIAGNALRMINVPAISTPPQRLSQEGRHQLAQPMTGAIFDILVYIFHDRLLQQGLISRELAQLSFRVPDHTVDTEAIQQGFNQVYPPNKGGFKDALLAARDYVGHCLAATWSALSPHYLSYQTVAATFLSIARRLYGWEYQNAIRDCFLWRQIGYGFNDVRPKSSGGI